MGCLSQCNSADPEIRRYQKNWIVLFNAHFLVGFAYAISYTSLHQFVTSKSTSHDANVQPGLGLSETWYSWIVGVSSIGEISAAITIAVLLRCSIYAKYLMLMGLAVGATGGILYSVGKNGWMLLIGRLCIGLYLGSQMTITRVYLGESSTTVIAMLPPEKQEKSKIKQTTIFIAFTVGSLPFVISPALAAIAAEIPGLDQFRWPGYWLTVHSAIVAILVIFLFKQKRSELKRESSSSTKQLPVPKTTIVYLVFAYFVFNTYFALLETLQNPIQGDQFGLSVKYTSYVFLGTQSLIIVGNVIMYVLQKYGLSNRIICLMALFLSISGSVISSDWQAIRGDPCDRFSGNITNRTVSYECYPLFHSLQRYIQDSEFDDTCNVTLPMELVNYTFAIGECTPCSANATYLSELMTSFGVGHSDHSLICLGSENSHLSTYMYHMLDCYWWFNTDCFSMTLAKIDSTLPEAGSGSATSGWPISSNSSDSEPVCNSTLHRKEGAQNRIMLEFGMESATTDCLTSKCSSQTNSYYEQYPIYMDDIDLDSCNSNTSCICESFSVPPFNCFWNPNSRITGQYCPRCEPLCRSTDHTINFIQFIVGISLITLAFPIGRGTLTLIVSDAMGYNSQGLIMGILVSVGSAARFTGPLWGNAAYHAVGHRTYLAMSIICSSMLVVIVLFLLLYRSMKPKGVYLAPIRTEDVELEDAMDYSNNSDRIELLKHFQVEELESELSNTTGTGNEEGSDPDSTHSS